MIGVLTGEWMVQVEPEEEDQGEQPSFLAGTVRQEDIVDRVMMPAVLAVAEPAAPKLEEMELHPHPVSPEPEGQVVWLEEVMVEMAAD